MEHIVEATDNIIRYTSGKSIDDLQSDDMMCYTVVYNILTIGEAAYHLTKAFKTAHADTQWDGIMRMRNVLAHDYYILRLQTVWEVIQNDLPILRTQVMQYLSEVDWEEWDRNSVNITETAVHKSLIQTAARMRLRGYEVDEICKITGLDREEIERL